MRVESHSLSLSLPFLFVPRNGDAAGAILVCEKNAVPPGSKVFMRFYV